MPKDDVVIFNYPYEFRKALADSYKTLLQSGVKTKLIPRSSYSDMWKSYYKSYGVDYAN